MAALVRFLLLINCCLFVLCDYCHVEDRSCPRRNVLKKQEVLDPEHCQQECDKLKARGCQAVEYFKGVCTVLKGVCPIHPLKRSPDTHYFYRPVKGKCESGDDKISHVNVARDRPAFQSDMEKNVVPLGPAKFAVDGSNEPDYTKRSCTQTRAQKSPYWFVDLGSNTTVTSVAITNRNDGLGWHLSDFTIAVLDRRPTPRDVTTSLDRICVYRNETFRGELGFVCYRPLEGRFVVIQLPAQSGLERILSLCEVEVFAGISPQGFVDGDAFDLARGRPAYQITTGGIPGKSARLAVDGNPERNLTKGHCSATDWIPNPWWAVDLQSEQLVRGVRLVNRADCCADRLSHLLVAVSRTPPSVGDAYHVTSSEECILHEPVIYGAAYLDCQQPIWGRYVLVIVGDTYLKSRQLSLCEVNVYAQY